MIDSTHLKIIGLGTFLLTLLETWNHKMFSNYDHYNQPKTGYRKMKDSIFFSEDLTFHYITIIMILGLTLFVTYKNLLTDNTMTNMLMITFTILLVIRLFIGIIPLKKMNRIIGQKYFKTHKSSMKIDENGQEYVLSEEVELSKCKRLISNMIQYLIMMPVFLPVMCITYGITRLIPGYDEEIEGNYMVATDNSHVPRQAPMQDYQHYSHNTSDNEQAPEYDTNYQYEQEYQYVEETEDTS